MNRDRFWLTDAQFARIEPHLPTDTRGKPRVDDRRVISGIVHVLKSGGRWIDAVTNGLAIHLDLVSMLNPLANVRRLVVDGNTPFQNQLLHLQT